MLTAERIDPRTIKPGQYLNMTTYSEKGKLISENRKCFVPDWGVQSGQVQIRPLDLPEMTLTVRFENLDEQLAWWEHTSQRQSGQKFFGDRRVFELTRFEDVHTDLKVVSDRALAMLARFQLEMYQDPNLFTRVSLITRSVHPNCEQVSSRSYVVNSQSDKRQVLNAMTALANNDGSELVSIGYVERMGFTTEPMPVKYTTVIACKESGVYRWFRLTDTPSEGSKLVALGTGLKMPQVVRQAVDILEGRSFISVNELFS